MKILLVNTPRSPYNGIREHAPPEALPFIHRKLVGPPLGLLTLATALTGHDVSLLETKAEQDLHPDGPPLKNLLLSRLEHFAPDIVGVTTIASEFPAAARIMAWVKEYNPAVVTVAGGLHATLVPEDFESTEADIVIPGPGAEPLCELAAALETHRSPGDVPGIFFRQDNTLRFTGERSFSNPATTHFYLPDRSLVEPWRETYRVGNGHGPVTYLFTSLGCPHRCTFCSIWPQFNGRYLQRHIESIITELDTCRDYPVVRFADANTVVDPVFIDTLFDAIEQEGIVHEYVMDLRADTIAAHPDLMEKLARGGLKVVICGFESFRDGELNAYNKRSDAGVIREAIRICHANGISLRGNYVVKPDYGHADFNALARFAADHPVDFAGYTILTPMPGTSFYTDIMPRICDHNLEKYNFFNCVLPTTLPREEFYRQVASLWLIKRGRDVI